MSVDGIRVRCERLRRGLTVAFKSLSLNGLRGALTRSVSPSEGRCSSAWRRPREKVEVKLFQFLKL